MEWFKHPTGAFRAPSAALLTEEYGLAAYGFLQVLLELAHAHGDGDPVTYPLRWLARQCRIGTKKATRWLGRIGELGMIDAQLDEVATGEWMVTFRPSGDDPLTRTPAIRAQDKTRTDQKRQHPQQAVAVENPVDNSQAKPCGYLHQEDATPYRLDPEPTPPKPSTPPPDLVMPTRMSPTLRNQAVDLLKDMDRETAQQVLDELEGRWDTVKNPIGWIRTVTRSLADFRPDYAPQVKANRERQAQPRTLCDDAYAADLAARAEAIQARRKAQQQPAA